jgi:hypothetical protein
LLPDVCTWQWCTYDCVTCRVSSVPGSWVFWSLCPSFLSALIKAPPEDRGEDKQIIVLPISYFENSWRFWLK